MDKNNYKQFIPKKEARIDRSMGATAVTAKRIKNKWELQNRLCKHCMLGKSKLPAFFPKIFKYQRNRQR